jgi:hypothetical protein
MIWTTISVFPFGAAPVSQPVYGGMLTLNIEDPGIPGRGLAKSPLTLREILEIFPGEPGPIGTRLFQRTATDDGDSRLGSFEFVCWVIESCSFLYLCWSS